MLIGKALLCSVRLLLTFTSSDIHLPSTTLSGTRNSVTPPTLPIGSLCLIDNRPHAEDTFSDSDALLLRQLAGLIGRECASQHLYFIQLHSD